MFKWPYDIGLIDALDLLPEPILIVGNKKVDGDTAGCVATLLEHLRFNGREAFTFFSEPLEESFQWMFSDEDSSETIIEDYASLVVVDDFVDGNRLGIPVKDVPIINIDHHRSNKPTGIPDEEASPDDIVCYPNGMILQYWADVPAAACVLVAENIVHPFLWVSIYMDTVFMTVKAISGANWISKLSSKLSSSGDPLTDELQETMLKRIRKMGSGHSLDKLMTSRLYFYKGTYKDGPIQICVGVIDSENHDAFVKTLSVLRMFSNVTVVVSKVSGRGSIRSDSDSYNALEVASKFGGGGHVRASGFSFDIEKPFYPQATELIAVILSDVSNIETKVYV